MWCGAFAVAALDGGQELAEERVLQSSMLCDVADPSACHDYLAQDYEQTLPAWHGRVPTESS